MATPTKQQDLAEHSAFSVRPSAFSLALPAVALLLALALALLLAVGWLGAPGQDVADMVRYLLLSGGLSLLLSGAMLFWLRRGRGRIWLQVALAYVLGMGLALFNIFLTAQLMFISDHDLLLLVLLLLFAALVSLGLGVGLARELAGRVVALNQGAQRLAAGDLAVRVQPVGGDELAELAHEFNRMAAMLEANAAEREQQEAARRELVAAVSHDLRTPLTALRVLTEALADGMVPDAATQARYLATMRSQIGLLNGLIDDLFELAQIEAGALRLERQRVAPAELVDEALAALQPQAEQRGVLLCAQVMAPLTPLLAAPQKIERVLHNLLGNAIRHTPAGGSVTLMASSNSNALLFEVIDTGEGIASEDLPHVFERFYRGEKSRSRATGGAGLGLAIARGIVAAHGGEIAIESTPGSGTRVFFSLPFNPTI